MVDWCRGCRSTLSSEGINYVFSDASHSVQSGSDYSKLQGFKTSLRTEEAEFSLAEQQEFLFTSALRSWVVPWLRHLTPLPSNQSSSNGGDVRGEQDLTHPQHISLENIWQSLCPPLQHASPLFLLISSAWYLPLSHSQLISQKCCRAAEEQHSLKALVRCHRDLWEGEADVCICVELEREAVPLVGEAELFADLLQRVLRFLLACALKQVVCLLLLNLESVEGQYTRAAILFLCGTEGEENNIQLFRLYGIEKRTIISCRNGCRNEEIKLKLNPLFPQSAGHAAALLLSGQASDNRAANNEATSFCPDFKRRAAIFPGAALCNAVCWSNPADSWFPQPLIHCSSGDCPVPSPPHRHFSVSMALLCIWKQPWSCAKRGFMLLIGLIWERDSRSTG